MFVTRSLLISLASAIIFLGCSSKKSETKEQEPEQPVLGKITLESGWARPGAQGQSSAAYFSISNGTASQDTIVSISSSIAEKTEIHESYKGENGISGMRPAANQVIPAGKDLYLQPGGLHVMLMKLKQDVDVGDSLQISITFKRTGTKNIRLPVQIQK